MQHEPIRETRTEQGHLSWVLDRPESANALSLPMLAWIQARAQALQGELVILSSPHPRFFSAGFDLRTLAKSVADLQACPQGPHPDDPLAACTQALAGAHGCLAAVVDAPVLGAAVELLAYFDQIFITPNASFQIPARKLGLLYHAAGIEQIRHRFGDRASFDMLVMGEKVGSRSLADLPRFSFCPQPSLLATQLRDWSERLLEQSPQTLGQHCARLRVPGPGSAEALGAYHAQRDQAYRRPELARLLAKKTQ